MQLYHATASPYVRKVMVTLHETGQLADVTIIPAQVTPTTTGDPTFAHNPLGKIPTLTRPEGPALYDSRVICRYLDARANGSLYPESRIWDVLTLEATADGIMEAAVLIVYEGRVRAEDKQSGEWVEAQWGKVSRALDMVGDRWMSHLGGRIDMGQVALGCALGYLDLRHASRDWRSGRSDLAAWYDAFADIPSMRATQPEPAV